MMIRIMVGLPSAENREMILKTLMSKEKHENLDFKELATMTEGFSGSDLKVNFSEDRLVSFLVLDLMRLITNFLSTEFVHNCGLSTC